MLTFYCKCWAGSRPALLIAPLVSKGELEIAPKPQTAGWAAEAMGIHPGPIEASGKVPVDFSQAKASSTESKEGKSHELQQHRTKFMRLSMKKS